NQTTDHSWPSRFKTMPFLRSLVVAMRSSIPVSVFGGGGAAAPRWARQRPLRCGLPGQCNCRVTDLSSRRHRPRRSPPDYARPMFGVIVVAFVVPLLMRYVFGVLLRSRKSDSATAAPAPSPQSSADEVPLKGLAARLMAISNSLGGAKQALPGTLPPIVA